MYIDRVIFVFILATYFLSPSLLTWISNGGTEWYRPYMIWFGIILINYWLIQGIGRDSSNQADQRKHNQQNLSDQSS